ncbi:MAG: hypothetical protein HQL96_03445 [Magnetococcales bacterium]|nr:hypothetical protein [Magnetococcales bacterium]
MGLHAQTLTIDPQDRIVRFVPPAQFKREASDWMTSMTDQLHRLEERIDDPQLSDSICRDMETFHQVARRRGLREIADLALRVARALEQVDPGRNEAAKRVVALSLVAVSQIQWLLNPSVQGAGENAKRILTGLLTKW